MNSKMLQKNKIHKIDVLEGLKELKDDSAQIIIADPPYNIGKDFGNNGGKEKKLKKYLEWCDKWIKECKRILKLNGTMFIYGFSEILAHISTRIPLNKRWLIWHYTNKNIPRLKFWQRSHESVLCCWKGDSKPNFNRDDVRVPYTEGFLNGSAGKKRPKTKGRLGGKRGTTYNAHPNGALPRDVIKISTLAGGLGRKERWFLCKSCNNVFHPKEIKKHREQKHKIVKHPTQKPIELSDKLILSARQKDGLILSPFAGVGSECISAKKMGLDFIGFELNPDYIKIANKRLENITGQKKLF